MPAARIHGNLSRTLLRNFVDVRSRIKITPDQISVRLKRHTRNSLLREAVYVGSQGPIPWMDHREFVLNYL
ncbi:MAG: hypothetical protein OXI38_06205 [Bacteroidota bacterium]|nr:hypothetical protein [Bacteroidota bacterium]